MRPTSWFLLGGAVAVIAMVRRFRSLPTAEPLPSGPAQGGDPLDTRAMPPLSGNELHLYLREGTTGNLETEDGRSIHNTGEYIEMCRGDKLVIHTEGLRPSGAHSSSQDPTKEPLWLSNSVTSVRPMYEGDPDYYLERRTSSRDQRTYTFVAFGGYGSTSFYDLKDEPDGTGRPYKNNSVRVSIWTNALDGEEPWKGSIHSLTVNCTGEVDPLTVFRRQ